MNDPHLSELSPEELARRLDESMAAGRSRLRRQQEPDDPRIAVAQRLSNAQHPTLSPEMSTRIQAKMLAAHRQRVGRQRASRPQFTMVYRWAAVLAAAVVIFSAAAMPTVASSVPGEFWYPVKRSIESVEVIVATSASARAEVYLTQAERRINEVQVLLQRRSFDANLMIDARKSLLGYQQSAHEIGTTLPMEEARAAGVTESIAILLQEAERSHIVAGSEVAALIPTVIGVPTLPPTSTPTSPATFTTEVVEKTPILDVQSSQTSEPASTPAITQLDTPVPSESPIPSDTPLPTATETALPPVLTMYALENTNVRGQPARNQLIIAVIPQGEAVEVTGEDDTGKWWHVHLADSRTGWVAKFLLSLDKPIVASTNADGNNGSNGGSNTGNDFGCEHPGNYCDAPGQNGIQPTPSNGNGNGNNNGNGNGNGQPSNPGGGGKP